VYDRYAGPPRDSDLFAAARKRAEDLAQRADAPGTTVFTLCSLSKTIKLAVLSRVESAPSNIPSGTFSQHLIDRLLFTTFVGRSIAMENNVETATWHSFTALSSRNVVRSSSSSSSSFCNRSFADMMRYNSPPRTVEQPKFKPGESSLPNTGELPALDANATTIV
jgi:hypothetical protein